jgi:outer membrane scaffolding protein for murein synthesis (MipA/OmpV family)
MKKLLILCACALASPALAAGRAPEPVWDITLGAGAAMRPTFEGSDRYVVRPLPLLSVRWRDTISFGEGGLSAYWHHRNFRIGGGLTFDGGRDDTGRGGIFGSGDDRLKGLGKIDTSLGLRAFASYRLGVGNFEVAATKYTGKQNDGVVVNLGLSAPLPLNSRLIVMPHVRATWANDNYMEAYFGVTPVQAAASIFPLFQANAGFKDVRGGVNVIYRLNRHWFVAADASAVRLLGSAAASPISISDTSALVTSMIGYRF